MNELKELQKLLDEETAQFRKFSRKFYFIAATIFMTLAFAIVLFPKDDTPPSWHEEIFPSERISFIRDGNVAPLLLVQVDGEWHPLNIVDDSIIPRHGKLLPLKILFGFTSAHAENTLKYKEKTGNDPVADYRKKAIYYLNVVDGYGTVQRDFEIKDVPPRN